MFYYYELEKGEYLVTQKLSAYEFKKGKKPEKLISRILELCTNEGDLVLDFFAGSGTTGAVAMKMNRKFILCEQMDYIQDITCQRLIQTIMHDSRGISSEVNWQGGGSFVYCELANANQNFVDEIQSASSLYEIKDIYLRIIETGFISSKVNPRNINDNVEDFYALSLEDQKCFLMELLDKNLLYVNYCDIDDEEYAISDEDKEFTRNFYGEV
ncbi:DNA methyltransferase [Dorea longicatena]|uniref:DNA methyltransferase n=1 Tax=Dorea longicatena TaxID=88431 RepID=UPI001106365A|nr:DNA methyltransferase [Dorea longicatena]